MPIPRLAIHPSSSYRLPMRFVSFLLPALACALSTTRVVKPPRVVFNFPTSSHDPRPTITVVGARPSDLNRQQEHALELVRFANESNRVTKDKYLNKGEFGISPLERLYRVALFSIKENAPAEDVCCAYKWLNWWDAIQPPLLFDIRSVTERFYAYASERQLGFIPDTEEITRFEHEFNEEYLDFLELDTYSEPTFDRNTDGSVSDCSLLSPKMQR